MVWITKNTNIQNTAFRSKTAHTHTQHVQNLPPSEVGNKN